MAELSELVAVVCASLRRYLVERPSVTYRSLEMSSGVPRRLLAQLDVGEYNCASVRYEILFDLVRYLRKHGGFNTSEEKRIAELMKQEFAELIDPALVETEHPIDLANKHNFLIYSLASHHGGIKREMLLSIFGEIIEKPLNSLLQLEHLVERDNTIFLPEKKWVSIQLALVKQHQKTFADYTVYARTPYNHSHIFSESLTPEAAEMVSRIHYEAYQKIDEIAKNPKNHGDLPVFSFASCDLFSYREVDHA